MIKAFYTVSTAPQSGLYKPQKFEIICSILSSLVWQKLNGPTKIYLDSKAYKYFKKYNLLQFYTEVDSSLLNNIDKNINYREFWTASKLYALRDMLDSFSEMVMLDNDMICWKNIDNIVKDVDLCVAHVEAVTTEYYGVKDNYNKSMQSLFKSWMNFDVYAFNTAICYIKNNDSIKAYLDGAFNIMKNLTQSDNHSRNMIFVEQRLLAMITARDNLKYKTFLQDIQNQDLLTHIWAKKTDLKKDTKAAQDFLKQLLTRIALDFPKAYENIKEIVTKLP